MRSAILYNLHNLKKRENIYWGVLLFVNVPAKVCNFTKITLLYGCKE